jgi:GTP cyclohydrolase I
MAHKNMENKNKPTRVEAEAAVRTLIAWANDDPEREGLIETPKRVVAAYEEFFCGYHEDPAKVLAKTFSEVENYQDMVILKNLDFESHCEHHMVPIIGRANIAYIPDQKVVGISKLARLLDIYAKRLQTQETMTMQISNTINQTLAPKGVAVLIEADHQCMSIRGVHKTNSSTLTSSFTGAFEDEVYRNKFFQMIGR